MYGPGAAAGGGILPGGDFGGGVGPLPGLGGCEGFGGNALLGGVGVAVCGEGAGAVLEGVLGVGFGGAE